MRHYLGASIPGTPFRCSTTTAILLYLDLPFDKLAGVTDSNDISWIRRIPGSGEDIENRRDSDHKSGDPQSRGFLSRYRKTLLVIGGVGLLLGSAVIVIAIFFLVFGGTKYWTRPGSPVVYARIEAHSDCRKLQREFDAAMRSLEDFQQGELGHDISISYADTAESRMSEIGCADPASVK